MDHGMKPTILYKNKVFVAAPDYGKYAPNGKEFVVSQKWFEQWYHSRPETHELEFFVEALREYGFPAVVGEDTDYPGPDAYGVLGDEEYDYNEDEEQEDENEWPDEVESAFYQAMDKGHEYYQRYEEIQKEWPPQDREHALIENYGGEFATQAFDAYKKFNPSSRSKERLTRSFWDLDVVKRFALVHHFKAFDAEGTPASWVIDLGAYMRS
jgi:hypothetical protein